MYCLNHYYLLHYFLWDWGMNSGLHICKAGALQLESQPLVHFALVILEVGGVSQTICLGWPQTMILQISASPVARITNVGHQQPTHLNHFILLYLFFAVLGLELRAFTLSHSTSPIFL
jgi:hypothetical protein